MGNFLRFSFFRGLIRLLLMIFGIIFLLISWRQNLGISHEKSILYLIDNSLSMTVRDIAISEQNLDSRLTIAKNFAHSFSEKISGNEAIASFSREITLETPFTNEKNLIKNVISGISPMIYGGGSNVFSAIDSIVNIYKNRENLHIIVLTDAENFDTMQKIAKIPPYISFSFIGIGTEKGGLMLEGYSTDGQPSYRQFEGKNAISRLDKNTLSLLEKEFSAQSFVIDSIDDFDEIQSQIFSLIQKVEKKFDFYGLFGIIFLIFSLFFPPYIFLKNEKIL